MKGSEASSWNTFWGQGDRKSPLDGGDSTAAKERMGRLGGKAEVQREKSGKDARTSNS